MIARRAGAVVALVVLLALGASSGSVGAQAGSASSDQVAALATKAVSSDQALAELRRITEVDGRPADLHSATADLGAHRRARLRALAAAFHGAGGGVAAPRAQDARAQAKRVLDADKFHEQKLPKPFKGALEWLADRLRPIGKAFEPLGDLLDAVPGGGYILLALLAAGLGWLVWWLAQLRSNATVSERSSSWSLVDPTLDPAELERQADAARAAGDYSRSLRLYHEAGIVRMARADRIVVRPATTARDVAQQVSEASLDELTTTFEQVVYGGREATESECERSRRGWLELVGSRSAR